MTGTLKLTAIAAVVMFIVLLLPGTAKAQEPIKCWQEGAFNIPRTCVCTTGYWLWLQPYGTGFCPWNEAGKTSVEPANNQQLPAPVEPLPTENNNFPYPEKREQENKTQHQPYYNPNPMPNELIYPQANEIDEIFSVGGSFMLVFVLFLILIFGFYKTITR